MKTKLWRQYVYARGYGMSRNRFLRFIIRRFLERTSRRFL